MFTDEQRGDLTASAPGVAVLTDDQRRHVVTKAMTWLGTTYHHRAAVRGAGADCAMFPLSVFQVCGILPFDYRPPAYSVQWHLHHSEELYLKELARFAIEVTTPPRPADLVIFRFGRTFSHGAIVLDWPLIIHSCIPHGVVLSDATRDADLAGRDVKLFTMNAEAGLRESGFHRSHKPATQSD